MTAPEIHFRQVGTVDVGPLADAVTEHAHLFGLLDWREKAPGTPHLDTETIYLRMPSEITIETVFHSLEVADLPAMEVPAFAEAVRRVEAMTGESVARCMIVKLKPGGIITPHIDQGAYAEATHRYHLAVETNPGAWLQIDAEKLSMAPGQVWFFDKHALHMGANDGDSDRIHLIVDTFRPTVKSALTFQTEKLFDVKGEALPLLARHWEEIALDKETVPLDPDWDLYRKIEDAGIYHVTTARKDGRLVGYAAYVLSGNFHYRSLYEAVVDIFFLAPELRKGSAGMRLLQAAEQALVAKGVNKIVTKDKLHFSLAPLMKRMGYRAIETVYIKRVG